MKVQEFKNLMTSEDWKLFRKEYYENNLGHKYLLLNI